MNITLPTDVIDGLSALDEDLGWAVVKLFRRMSKAKQPTEVAALVQFPGNRALILVKPEVCINLRGVSPIPLSDGRAFLALDPAKGVADLEISVVDRLDAPGIGDVERAALMRFRELLRLWRVNGIRFESRAIVIATFGPTSQEHASLPEIQSGGIRRRRNLDGRG